MPQLLLALLSPLRSIKPKLRDSEPLQRKRGRTKKSNEKRRNESSPSSLFCCCSTRNENRDRANKDKSSSNTSHDQFTPMLARQYNNNHHGSGDPRFPINNTSSHVTTASAARLQTSQASCPVDQSDQNLARYAGSKPSNFDKYNRLTANPHRQVSPLSRLAVDYPSTVSLPEEKPGNERWKRRQNRPIDLFSVNSTCVRAPPTRTLLKSEDCLIVGSAPTDKKLHQEFDLTSNVPYGRPGPLQCPKYTPPYSRREPGGDGHRPPPFDSVALLPDIQTSPSKGDDPPPEYSEPPDYYAGV
ncbi:unnamed protein product [Clavelina lepadiformis]|uniref:Uncharacterized protein n=1 Tax=Clavelina lepadiformis TaxID=159417 RepID=A0ABP0FQ58_CLALP